MHLSVLPAGTLWGELSDPEQSSRAYLDKTLQGVLKFLTDAAMLKFHYTT